MYVYSILYTSFIQILDIHKKSFKIENIAIECGTFIIGTRTTNRYKYNIQYYIFIFHFFFQ